MSAKKFLLAAVTSSLGLAGFLAPYAFADQTYTDTYSSGNGQYGYYINGNYGRYQNWNGPYPFEVITGSGSNAKYLFGVSATIPINVRQQAYSYRVRSYLRLSQTSTNFNAAGNAFSSSSPIEATVTFADRSSERITDCEYSTSGETNLSAHVMCEFTNTKVPTEIYITWGYVGTFTFNQESYLGYYSSAFNNGSIKVAGTNVTITEFSSSQDQENADIGQISDSLDQIHQDEKDTIENNAQDAQDAASGLNIGFSVGNPFLNWFALFRDDTCVAIPTIRSWLGINETQVCSPWNGTPVRSIATPIFSILSGMILFGFIVRWLKGNDFDGSIELDG